MLGPGTAGALIQLDLAAPFLLEAALCTLGFAAMALIGPAETVAGARLSALCHGGAAGLLRKSWSYSGFKDPVAERPNHSDLCTSAFR